MDTVAMDTVAMATCAKGAITTNTSHRGPLRRIDPWRHARTSESRIESTRETLSGPIETP